MLKYRLAPTSEDDTEFKTFAEAGWSEMQAIQTYGPLAIEDGRQAVRVVRQRSEAFGFRRDRVGIVGFSAGGVIAAATAMAEDAELRPEFAGVIDGAPPQIRKVGDEVPPLFLAYANDDKIVQNGPMDLFRTWNEASRPCELHVYARGGHGFGIDPQGLPSDHWIEQFALWLEAKHLVNCRSTA